MAGGGAAADAPAAMPLWCGWCAAALPWGANPPVLPWRENPAEAVLVLLWLVMAWCANPPPAIGRESWGANPGVAELAVLRLDRSAPVLRFGISLPWGGDPPVVLELCRLEMSALPWGPNPPPPVFVLWGANPPPPEVFALLQLVMWSGYCSGWSWGGNPPAVLELPQSNPPGAVLALLRLLGISARVVRLVMSVREMRRSRWTSITSPSFQVLLLAARDSVDTQEQRYDSKTFFTCPRTVRNRGTTRTGRQ